MRSDSAAYRVSVQWAVTLWRQQRNKWREWRPGADRVHSLIHYVIVWAPRGGGVCSALRIRGRVTYRLATYGSWSIGAVTNGFLKFEGYHNSEDFDLRCVVTIYELGGDFRRLEDYTAAILTVFWIKLFEYITERFQTHGTWTRGIILDLRTLLKIRSSGMWSLKENEENHFK